MGGTGSVLACFSASVGSGAGGSSMVTSGAGVASGTSACSSSAIWVPTVLSFVETSAVRLSRRAFGLAWEIARPFRFEAAQLPIGLDRR